ncbi:hypothetical protein F441_05886 [Phytophthora nicotianae CJ01A1]|uniref:Uncharacterized protein n=2 Tax=Phytophthora nicotianae TaxID=4792 RepID=W2ZLG9_PHYNI|nr:hypothetical protein F441_05886 [Phytophthora nicotianae CJ01A1]ETP47885.1 hypothetical protein F442_06237 [Phytophthora nicotianae P10297]
MSGPNARVVLQDRSSFEEKWRGDGDVATPTSSSLSLSFEEEEKGETPSVCDVEDVARGVQSALW